MTRLLDIFLSSIAIIILSPILISTILILKLTGEGEVFFLQKRVGIDKITFMLVKFATMLKNSENIGTGTITVFEDPRILPFGHFLRRTKLNELPQLFNILYGTMSIIGPRPQTKRCYEAFPKSSIEYIKRVKPGLSGIGSIIFRDEELMMHNHEDPGMFYDKVIMPYKGLLEEWFVVNKSLYIYFLAIFMTVWAVLIPTTKMAWKIFKDLPDPPEVLKQELNYPS